MTYSCSSRTVLIDIPLTWRICIGDLRRSCAIGRANSQDRPKTFLFSPTSTPVQRVQWSGRPPCAHAHDGQVWKQQLVPPRSRHPQRTCAPSSLAGVVAQHPRVAQGAAQSRTPLLPRVIELLNRLAKLRDIHRIPKINPLRFKGDETTRFVMGVIEWLSLERRQRGAA
jgi:hypothetical protein